MRKVIAILTVVAGLGALAAGSLAADRSQRRVKEITVTEGSIKIRATGVLKTTVDVYDSNDIANASFDYGMIEDHRDALRALGFTAVHVETVTGQKLDKPL